MPRPSELVRDAIIIRGARQNNLKGINLDLDLNKFHVITGPSGSGKSSLAFDTIYAEGQRRYVETFSPYTRQFLDRMDKPLVDEIRGIPPAIAIEQANRVRTTRSTVGTMTEINDYLKLLMPRVAKAFCPECGREIVLETSDGIATTVYAELKGHSVLVAFGVPAPPGTKPSDFFAFLNQQGFLRVWLNHEVLRTDTAPQVKRLPAIVAVIQDRVTLDESNRVRLVEAVEHALRYGKGQLSIVTLQPVAEHRFSTGWHCPYCDLEIRPPTPGLFSFNNPLGACPACRGFGRTIGIDLDRAMPDRSLSIADGVVKPFQTGQMRQCQQDLLSRAIDREIDIHCPFEDLAPADQNWIVEGDIRPDLSADEVWESGGWYGVRGFFNWMESRSYKMHVRVFLSRYRAYTLCPQCKGTRFKPETLNFKVVIGGERYTLSALHQMPVDVLSDRLRRLDFPQSDGTTEILRSQIVSRLDYLANVGLGYLTLDRPTRSLSGGEIQRVNLTTCLGASLVNTLFVLDEPSVGLHPRDVHRLNRVLHGLRDKGNTLLVVEHEEAVIRSADNLIEIGPGRGELGGELVFHGPLDQIEEAADGSLTAAYLTGRKQIVPPKKRRKPTRYLEVIGAREHNLRNIDVKFPLELFCCVSGVSGSGKSTLVQDVLYENVLRLKGGSSEETPGICERITGAHDIDEVLLVDQSPLARSPRSTPAVYIGVFDQIRDLFSQLPESIAAGLSPGAFSFNSGAGRCERCSGLGYEKVEMQFLSDQYIRCAECGGRRYQPYVLAIKLAGKSIHDVLELTVTEAIAFFSTVKERDGLIEPLELLKEVGLGYLRLGQPVNILSGGESQRLKLVGHLAESKKSSRHSLLIFDEPTTGLHLDDIAALLSVFHRLVEQGNTLVVIEHNLEVIQSADHVIDLGPEAGVGGGNLVGTGTPEELAKNQRSHTGIALREKMVADSRRLSPITPRVAEAPAILKKPEIAVHGARHHNLKNLSLTLPQDKMVVITGLSGSGKSSLAFDILFAEGQRRFMDSMSTYARQFVEQLERPDVDHVEGLPPSVAIEQRVTRGSGKSTVATLTEVYHFLRLLFAKLGTQYCPKCTIPVTKMSASAIARQVTEILSRGAATLAAPLVKARKGYHKEVATWAGREGYTELVVDGNRSRIDEFPLLERYREHSIDVVIGELHSALPGNEIQHLVKKALKVGGGAAFLMPNGAGASSGRSNRGKAASRAIERVVLSSEMSCPRCGDAFEELDPRLFSFNSPHGWCTRCNGFGYILPFSADEDDAGSRLEAELAAELKSDSVSEDTVERCPNCDGSRLNSIARAVRVNGYTIDQITRGSVRDTLALVENLDFDGTKRRIGADILSEIIQRLSFMRQVGLDYLTLDRSAKTLSGGESQRIRLAAQLGSNLRGVLYVLDEPSIGLHPRDNVRLLDTLQSLKEKGNTLVVVEHDEETMRRADLIVDLGPGAGRRGGKLVALGSIDQIKRCQESVTGKYLLKPMHHPISGSRRPLDDVNWLEISGAHANNLKEVDVRFPIGRLSVITGVSGSGKSTLLRSVLLPAVRENLGTKRRGTGGKPPTWRRVSGVDHLGGVFEVDQSPIGKTSRSIPATYVKIFDDIRALFGQLPESRIRGYNPSRFSFNTEGGRCELCAGQGVIKLEMNFLPSSYIPCETCGGKRFNPQTLEIQFNEKSVGDILEMTIEEAADFFRSQPRIHKPLELLTQTGLGYLQLGQPSPTLSGGEAQRLKLVSELKSGVAKAINERLRKNRIPKSTLYLLEEPTIGLHMADVQLLVEVLHRLVDEGNTVVVIEHNLDVIAEADYIVDIGPEAGTEGGNIIAAGSPEEVARSNESRTAPFIRRILETEKKRRRAA